VLLTLKNWRGKEGKGRTDVRNYSINYSGSAQKNMTILSTPWFGSF